MPTAYELERAANIARNKALLEELELKDAVASISAPVKTPKPKTKAKPIQPRKSAVKTEAEDFEPRRQSARLRRTVEDTTLTPAQKRKREKEIAERDAMEAEERLQAEEAARIAKRPRHHDLDWQALANGITTETEIPSLRNSLMGFVNSPYPREIGDRDRYVFDDKDQENSEVADLRQRLEGLKVVSRAKVTKDRIYSSAYHPEPSKDLVFFGDKHGQLGIWDARAEPEEDDEDERPAEEREGGRYWKLQTHWPATSKSSISAIKFDPVDAHSLYTCSYDGTVRHLSFVSGISREIYFSDGDLPTCIDLTPDGNEMWITDGNGWLTHMDLRQDSSHAKSYQLANNKVGCVSVNPVDPHLVLTAFNDQIIKIWDARKLQIIGDIGGKPFSARQKKSDSEPTTYDTDEIDKFLDTPKGKNTLRGEWRHDRAVGSAYWDSHGKRIVSTSYDNNLRLWDFSVKALKGTGLVPTMRPHAVVKHDCQTGRWVTPFKAQWSPNPNVLPHFTIGNMKHSLDIYSCTGELLARLQDSKRITAVQAVTASHPSIVERVVSGNASGRCVLWAPGDESEEEEEES